MEIKKNLRPKIIILDFDNTLYYLNIDWVKVKKYLSKLFLAYGIKSNFTPLSLTLSKSLNMINNYFDQSIKEELNKKIITYLAKQEIEGVKKGVSQLQSKRVLYEIVRLNIKAVIVSNNFSKTIHDTMVKEGWPKCKIIGKDNIINIKSKYQNISLYLKSEKTNPMDVWAIGDGLNDYREYTKAKIGKIFLLSECKNGKSIHLDSLEDLLLWIK